MSGVRPLSRLDLPQVVDLYIRTFRRDQRVQRQAVLEYFEKVYFDSPWHDPEIPSLVGDEGDGNIWGFLGVFPRPMRNRNRLIRAAVLGQLMVSRDTTSAFGSARLIKAALRGKQDLALGDSAADGTRKIWELCGGTVSRLYSFHWLRPIRPFSFGLEHLLNPGHALLKSLLTPFCSLADVASDRIVRAVSRRVPDDSIAEEVSVEELAGRILQSTDHSLVPEYNNGSLVWLLRAAATKRGRGEIKQRLVRNRSGEVLGWYIYYLNVGGTSDVLQIGASPATIDRVFACLVEEAERHHSIGLFGRLDPRFMHALWEQKCFFTTPSWVLVHAKDPVLLDSFHTGEALFTGLEGEQWMRFDGDPFQS